MRKDIADKELEEDRQRTQERIELISEVTTAFLNALSERSKEREKAIDEDIAQSERREEQFNRIAERGQADATENAAFEQRKQAELALQKEREQRKQQNIALVTGAIESYSAKTSAGDKNALASTLTEIALLKAAVSAIDFFFEGTDDTGKVSKPLDAQGGRFAVLHDNEQVWSKKNVQEGGNRTRQEAIDILQAVDRGDFIEADKAVYSHGQLPSPGVETYRFMSNNALLQAVNQMTAVGKDTNKAIKDLPSRMPVETKEWDADNKAIVHGLRRGNTFKRRHFKQGSLFQ